MEVVLRQKVQAQFFDKTFGLKFLHPVSFRMVMITVVDKTEILCFWSTAMTETMFGNARTEYCSAHTIDDDEPKTLVHCDHYRIEVNQRQDIQVEHY